MLVNPDIKAWFEKLQGQPTGHGGGASGRPVQGLAGSALEGIVKPGSGMFGFNAPSIGGERFQPRAPLPNPAERSPSGSPVPFEGIPGGGANLGGGALAAGLGKLGAGLSGGLQDLKAKQDALAAARGGYVPLKQLGGPLSDQMARNPGAQMPDTTPAAPTFSPVGGASNTPILAQPGGGAGAMGESIGPPGAELPILAQGGGGSSTANSGNRPALVYNGLLNKGWSPNAARAMTATLMGESSGSALNTGIYQGEGGFGPAGTTWDRLGSPLRPAAETAGGIANWNGPRAIAFNKWAIGNGKDPNSLDSQIEYVDKEARQMGVPVTSNADPAGLTNRFTGQYEAPATNNGVERWARYGGFDTGQPTQTSPSPSAQAFGAAPPNLNSPIPQLAGPPPTPNTGAPTLISPGQPQTGPAYSEETWNNRPQYDYGGMQPSPTPLPPPRPSDQPPLLNGGQPGVYSMPDQQGMNDQLDPLATALAGGAGGAGQVAPPDQSALLAMMLAQNSPDFSAPDFGGLSDLFG